MDKRGRTDLKQGIRETVRNLFSARVWCTIATVAIISTALPFAGIRMRRNELKWWTNVEEVVVRNRG